MREWLHKDWFHKDWQFLAWGVVGGFATGVVSFWAGMILVLLIGKAQDLFVDEPESKTEYAWDASPYASPYDAPHQTWVPAVRQRADTTDMKAVGRWGGSIVEAAVDSQVVYGNGWGMVEIVDFTGEEKPVQSGTLSLPNAGFSASIALSGDYAYVAEAAEDSGGHAAVRVIDVRDPARPHKVGRFEGDLPGRVRSIDAAGRHVYAVEDSVQVIDVSDPARPHKVGAFGKGAREVAVEDERAGLTRDDSLKVFDVSAPAAPRALGALRFDDEIADVAVAGDHAYVAVNDQWWSDDPDGASHGLRVVDISGSAALRTVATFDTPGHISEVAISGSHAYITYTYTSLGDEKERLQMIDVTDPTALQPEAPFTLPYNFRNDSLNVITVSDLVAAGRYAYIASRNAGVIVVRVPEE